MTEIKAYDAGNVLIMPKKAGPVWESSRVFSVSEKGGAILVGCANPFRNGKMNIRLGSPTEAPVTCAFAGSKNAQEFDIPAGVDSLELIYEDQNLTLRYDVPASQNVPKPKPEPRPEPKPEPKPAPKPEPKPVPKPELKTGNAFAQLQEAFSKAIEEAEKHVDRCDNEQVTVIRQQIMEKIIEPYRSADKNKETALAEELLYITRILISGLIDKEQENADKNTLPK